MGWKSTAEESAQSERIPGGTYDGLKIVRVIRQPKDGLPYQSKAGDPQILCVVSDNQDREALIRITLSEKAFFVLVRLMDAMGADLEKMDEEGVDYRHFADELFATKNLVDRPFRGEVSWKKGDDGNEYADVKPIRPRPDAKPKPPESNDIPI